MVYEFRGIKKVVIPLIICVIMPFYLSGCTSTPSKKLLSMINRGEAIAIGTAAPSYEIQIKGTQVREPEWVQLDQLRTFGVFRQNFDSLFNIIRVTENGVNGKSGCLYVGEDGRRNGNTTLEDALRNKAFVTKYWNDVEVKNKLIEIAELAYKDVKDSDSHAIAGAINAYYNLLSDWKNPDVFNPTKSLTREEFYTLVYKTEEGVQNIEIDKEFENAVGGETNYTKFAQNVDEYGFLQVSNKSLDAVNYKGPITRLEAIYLLVNKHFKDELDKVTGKESAFIDTKNAGDLALKAKFKVKDPKTKEIRALDRWQTYTLALMIAKEDVGMQEELYKAMVVAKKLGLIEGNESRWDEPLNRAEVINLIIKVHLVKNELYGYLTDVEYGEIDESKVEVGEKIEELGPVLGEDEFGKYGEDWAEEPESITKDRLEGIEESVDPNKVVNFGNTLLEVWEIINDYKDSAQIAGRDKDKIIENMEIIAKDFGTSLDELRRLREFEFEEDRPQPVKQPSNNNNQSSGSSGNTGGGSSGSSGNTGGSSGSSGNTGGSSGSSGNTGGSSGSSGGSQSSEGRVNPNLPPELDKNNNGINDHFEGYGIKAEDFIPGEPDPNITLTP